MDPMTVGLILSAIGLGAGAYTSGKASATNAEIASMNAASQGNDAALARAMAERQFKYSTAPTTSLRGDVTRYDPALGWVIDASPVTQQLQGGSDVAQQGLTSQAIQQLRALGLDNTRQLQEYGVGDAALARYLGLSGMDNITPQLQQLAGRNVNRGFDDTQNALASLGLRSGQGTASAYSKLAKDRAETLSDEMSRATLQGSAANDQLQTSALSRALGSYQSMRAPTNFRGFTPAQDSLTSALASQRNIVPQASPVGAYMGTGVRLSDQQPDYGLANSLVAGGSLFTNYQRDRQASKDNAALLQMLRGA